MNSFDNQKTSKIKNVDLIKFYSVLSKLTDDRFNFSVYRNPNLQDFRIEMYYCNEYITSTNFEEFHQFEAFDCLVDLIKNCIDYEEIEKQNAFFYKFGVSFELYHNKLSGKNYFSFRKDESEKWVKISKELAEYILSNKEIEIDGLCDNVISYCEYDAYYHVNIKGE